MSTRAEDLVLEAPRASRMNFSAQAKAAPEEHLLVILVRPGEAQEVIPGPVISASYVPKASLPL